MFGVMHSSSSGLAIPKYDRGSSAFISTKISSSLIRSLPRRRLIRSCSFCASSCFTLALNSQRQSLPSPSSDIPRMRSTKPLSVSHRSFRQYQLNLCLLSREEFSAAWKVSSGVLSKPTPFQALSRKPP